MLRSSLTLLFLLGFFGCGDSEKIIPVSDNNATSDNRVSPNPEDNDLQSEQTSAPDSLETHNVKFAGIEMIWVEPGEFQMGSSLDSPVRIMDEKPRQIKITRGFYLGKYEITQRQYSVVMEDNVADLNPRPSRFPGPRHPVEQVSWKDAQEFCARLTYLERRDRRLHKGWAYSLPSEAEWEYACRAGSNTLYSWGDEIFLKNAAYRQSAGRTKLTGQFPSNRWGFFDMHGNVWEWVDDWYGNYDTDSLINPEGTEIGTSRVLRGGSWANLGTNLRSAGRHYLPPNTRSPTTGFRLCYKKVQ